MQPQWIETDHHKVIYKTYDYVPGVIASGRFAFISRQIGFEEDGSLSDDPKKQTAIAFANLGEIIKAIPASPRDVVDIISYHVGLQKHFQMFNAEKKKFVGD